MKFTSQWLFIFLSLGIELLYANEIQSTKSKAQVYCVSNEAVGAALLSIEPLRTIFSMKTQVVAAHCDELTEKNIALLASFNISAFNVCPSIESTIFGMPTEIAKKRLRSWWCKPAAVVMVPYDEVMLVDVDAIFFKNPETLFNAKGITHLYI